MGMEAALMSALGIMGTVVATLAGAVVALWRMQVSAAEKCEAERKECEKEQDSLRARIDEMWGRLLDLNRVSCTAAGCLNRTPLPTSIAHLNPEGK